MFFQLSPMRNVHGRLEFTRLRQVAIDNPQGSGLQGLPGQAGRPPPPSLWCAVDEVHARGSGRCRLPAPAAEMVETPLRRQSLVGRVLGALGRIVRPGVGRGPGGTVAGELG